MENKAQKNSCTTKQKVRTRPRYNQNNLEMEASLTSKPMTKTKEKGSLHEQTRTEGSTSKFCLLKTRNSETGDEKKRKGAQGP
jgi:hypothetical protein